MELFFCPFVFVVGIKLICFSKLCWFRKSRTPWNSFFLLTAASAVALCSSFKSHQRGKLV